VSWLAQALDALVGPLFQGVTLFAKLIRDCAAGSLEAVFAPGSRFFLSLESSPDQGFCCVRVPVFAF